MADLKILNNTTLHFAEAAAPSTPDAGEVVTYAKSDGLMYSKDDAGMETLMSGGAGGGGGGGAAEMAVGSFEALALGTMSTTNAIVADRVYVMKMTPREDITVSTVYWQCGTSAGNIDYGIYDEALTTKLGSTGSFASPGTGARSQALTGSVALTAGTVYYAAAHFSNATIRVTTITILQMGFGAWNLNGMQSSVSLPLPSSVTASWDPGTTFPVFFFK